MILHPLIEVNIVKFCGCVMIFVCLFVLFFVFFGGVFFDSVSLI